VRILQLANFVAPASGGIRTTLEALGRGYTARGVERVLVIPGQHDRVTHGPEGKRIEIRSPRLPTSGGYRIITRVNEVRKIVEQFQPDAVEISDRLTLVRAAEWGRARGATTMLFAHERLDALLAHRLPFLIRPRPHADRWNRQLADAFDTVVCPSKYGTEEFVAVGAQNVVRVALGVDLNRFNPARRNPALHRRLVRRGESLLVLCSRLSSEKRPDRAIEAIRVLAKRGVPVRLHIAGDGPLRPKLEKAAARLPVTFAGHVRDRDALAALLATADAVIAPAPAETFALAALEALACGTPVVCANTGALPELVTDGAGIATAGYGHALAAGLRAVLDWDPAARRATARRRAEHFGWDAAVERMLRLHGAPQLAAAVGGA
jgi:alpha-1,6-mannosyltransferase